MQVTKKFWFYLKNSENVLAICFLIKNIKKLTKNY